MITYSIRESLITSRILRLGFSVWANSQPKDYLAIYPKSTKEIGKTEKLEDVLLYAFVDDVWPRVVSSRRPESQKQISDLYVAKLKELGFYEIHLVSGFVDEVVLETFLNYANRITLSEFWKLLPQSKKDTLTDLNMTEVIGFLWHVYVLENAISKFELSGLIAGIRSEFFYLTARKLLPPHNLYFIDTT